MGKSRHKNKQSGAALVELAITLPLTLFILSMLLELGNIFLYLTWISQSSFNLVSLGALTPEGAVDSAVENRRLQIIQTKLIEEPLHRLAEMSGGAELNLSQLNRTVTVVLETTISPLGNSSLVFPYSNKLVGPYLLNTTDLAGSFSTFQNPEELDMYNCSGSQGGSSPSNCLITCERQSANPAVATCSPA